MNNMLKKIVGGTRSVASAFALVFSLVAFAWPSTAQAWEQQGVMRYAFSGTTIYVEGYYKDHWAGVCYDGQGFNLIQTRLPSGTTVRATPEFKSGGKYVKMAWTVTAGTTAVVNGMISPHTDVEID